MEAVLVAAVLDGAVLLEGVLVEAAVLHGQRVIHDQLRGHHRVHLGRVAAHVRDRVAQSGEVHQRGLAENVVADHAGWKPREIEVALAADQLAQIGVQHFGIGAPHQIFGVYARGVRKLVVGAWLDRVDCGAGIEIVQLGAGKRFAKLCIHGCIRVDVFIKNLPAPTGRGAGGEGAFRRNGGWPYEESAPSSVPSGHLLPWGEGKRLA